jgi:Protein of unknown function (DUF2934)
MNTSKKPATALSDSELSTGPVTEEAIRKRAYELYEQRGREDGYALDDWLAAENEIINPNEVVAA